MPIVRPPYVIGAVMSTTGRPVIGDFSGSLAQVSPWRALSMFTA
jgi:hypothetical protein